MPRSAVANLEILPTDRRYRRKTRNFKHFYGFSRQLFYLFPFRLDPGPPLPLHRSFFAVMPNWLYKFNWSDKSWIKFSRANFYLGPEIISTTVLFSKPSFAIVRVRAKIVSRVVPSLASSFVLYATF